MPLACDCWARPRGSAELCGLGGDLERHRGDINTFLMPLLPTALIVLENDKCSTMLWTSNSQQVL